MSYLSQFKRESGDRVFFPRLFGTGIDGDLVLSSNLDHGHNNVGIKQYRNLTIPAGYDLTNLAGNNGGAIIIAVSGTLTIAGRILANGGNATHASASVLSFAGAGSGGAPVPTSASIPAAGSSTVNAQPTPSSTVPGHSSAGSGCVAHRNTAGGSGSNGQQIQQQKMDRTIAVPQGGVLRMSGIPYPTNLALATAISGVAYSSAAPRATQLGSSLDYLFAPQCLIGAGGGGGGGAWDNGGSAFVISGAGGGGGGIVYIEARRIVLVSGHAIEAKGGNGGNAYASGGGAAGGTAGNGGRVVLVCRDYSGTPNINVAGGTKGLKDSAGVDGQDGLAGEYGVITV